MLRSDKPVSAMLRRGKPSDHEDSFFMVIFFMPTLNAKLYVVNDFYYRNLSLLCGLTTQGQDGAHRSGDWNGARSRRWTAALGGGWFSGRFLKVPGEAMQQTPMTLRG